MMRVVCAVLLLLQIRSANAGWPAPAPIEPAPGAAETHNNLGIALAQLGRIGEAIPEFQAALRIRPDFADAKANLARALRR